MCAVRCPGVTTTFARWIENLTIPTFAPPALPGDCPPGAVAREPEPERGRPVILRGGPILTLDEANPVGEALAIRGATIVDVGSLTEIKRHYTPGTEIVDLEGHAVLPGFVEPHVHVLASALAVAGIAAEEAPALFEDELERVAEIGARMLRELAMRGCTTAYDPGIGLLAGAAEHRLLEALARAPDAPVRIRGAFTPELAAALGVAPGDGDERYDVVGISYWADGALESFAAALEEPYLNGHGSGALLHEELELCEALRAWHDAGWQLVVHAGGDRATEQALRCLEALADGDLTRHRIERFAVVSDEQIARAAALGISVSHAINEVYYEGERLRDEILGPERAAHVHSLRRDLEHGLSSSCHSDSPSVPVDPCLALRTATTRLMRDSDDVLGPFQQLKLDEALRTVTVNPARQVLLGDRVGVLRTGMLADLVVLDRDPRDVAPERLHELRVIETWLGGGRQRWG
jgi:predicted amidohydrolase YtcJ